MNGTLWIVFGGFFEFQGCIKLSRQNVLVSADLRFLLPFHINFTNDLSLHSQGIAFPFIGMEAIFSSVLLLVIHRSTNCNLYRHCRSGVKQTECGIGCVRVCMPMTEHQQSADQQRIYTLNTLSFFSLVSLA